MDPIVQKNEDELFIVQTVPDAIRLALHKSWKTGCTIRFSLNLDGINLSIEDDDNFAIIVPFDKFLGAIVLNSPISENLKESGRIEIIEEIKKIKDNNEYPEYFEAEVLDFIDKWEEEHND